jgi:hypothetical protein
MTALGCCRRRRIESYRVPPTKHPKRSRLVRWERFISNVDWDDTVGKSTLKDWNQVMKVTIKRAAVIASVALGAAGGLIFADHPYWGSVLIVAGVAGAVYMYLSSERTQAENEDFLTLLPNSCLDQELEIHTQNELSNAPQNPDTIKTLLPTLIRP